MIFKSYILEQSFQSINNYKLFLFYGENQGLKKEFKERLKIQNKDQETLNLFQDDPAKFEALYVKMNLVCRNKLISMINGNINATKQWIEEEFRLEKKNVEVPMILVKAIRGGIQSYADDPLRDFLPVATSINAYLKKGSVQEWFIDLKANGRSTMTLTMTIRSDSEYRAAKQKGKLGAYTMLKLLYRG